MALSFRPYFEGGIEKLVKNEILPPLEFSDLEQCIECIKGKNGLPPKEIHLWIEASFKTVKLEV